MTINEVIKGHGWAGTSAVLLMRLTNLSGDLLTVASITSVKVYVREEHRRSVVVGGQPFFDLTPGDVLFDLLQIDAMWTRITGETVASQSLPYGGFNGRIVTPKAWLPEGKEYRIDVRLEDAAGSWLVPWLADTGDSVVV